MKFLCRDRVIYLLTLALLAQVIFWFYTKEMKPPMYIVPPVPGETEVKALAFGDTQLYFRVLALQIQNAGDSFGRFTALKEYDYHKLSLWFYLLDSLDIQSNFIPALASYYYSQTQNVPDVRYIVDYLVKHAEYDPPKNWWWLSQAVYLANHRLKDKELALKIAYKLAAVDADMPMWAKQMPAFILEDLGEKEQALAIIMGLAKDIDKLDPGEINFMNYFIKERLGYLEKTIKKPEQNHAAPPSAPTEKAPE